MSKKRNKSYNAQIDLSRLYGVGSEEEIPASAFDSNEIILVPINKIQRTPEQVRRYFDPGKMNQLILSIQKEGILENLLVSPSGKDNYQLISGERRLRAAKEVGVSQVPVKVLDLSEKDAFRISLIENLQREDLNPVEETDGIIKLIASELTLQEEEVISLLYQMQNKSTRGNLNHNDVVQISFSRVIDIFEELGKLSWQSFVKHRLPLRKLPEDILVALRQGKIAYTKAQAIARVKDMKTRKELLKRAINEKLSLKEINRKISEIKSPAKDQKENDQVVVLQERTANCLKALKKSDVWNSPTKKKKLEKLLMQLEKLL